MMEKSERANEWKNGRLKGGRSNRDEERENNEKLYAPHCGTHSKRTTQWEETD